MHDIFPVICQATFRAESSSVSNNRKFQIFQNCFQNVQLFPINLIKCLHVYADSYNQALNIYRLFDVWLSSPYTSRRKRPDY